MQNNTVTYGQQTLPFGEESLTFCLQDFPVNRSVRPANEKELTMTATCGQTLLEQFGKFVPGGSWAKMFSELLIGPTDWYSSRCALTWKMKGTKFNRTYFQLAASTPHIKGIERGLLPTPTSTSDAKGGCTRKDPKRQNDTLAHAIHGMYGIPGKTSQLNPLFVAEIMGFQVDWTELPFQDGEKNLSKPTEMR